MTSGEKTCRTAKPPIRQVRAQKRRMTDKPSLNCIASGARKAQHNKIMPPSVTLRPILSISRAAKRRPGNSIINKHKALAIEVLHKFFLKIRASILFKRTMILNKLIIAQPFLFSLASCHYYSEHDRKNSKYCFRTMSTNKYTAVFFPFFFCFICYLL